jgi:hypothetical protein
MGDAVLLLEALVEQSALLEGGHHLLDALLDGVVLGVDEMSGCNGSWNGG